MTDAEIEQYRASLATAPPLGLYGMAGMEGFNTNSNDADDDVEMKDNDDDVMGNNNDIKEDMETLMDENSLDGKDQKYLDYYINSQAIAEDSYNDPNRKYKCHRCKVAFTKQSYLSAHNKTLMHRKGDKLNYPLEKYLDPNRPFKCDTCKESFTQKNILLVHFNSVSHLHKLKQAGLDKDGQPLPGSHIKTEKASDGASMPPASTPSPTANAATAVSSPSTGSISTTSSVSPGVSSTPGSTPVKKEEEQNKPYKCNICKVSYAQGATLDIHIRSVLHQTRASKLHELAMTGEVDITKPLIEQPELNNKAQQKAIAEIMAQHRNSPLMMQPQMFFGLPGTPTPLQTPPLTPAQRPQTLPGSTTPTSKPGGASTPTTGVTQTTPKSATPTPLTPKTEPKNQPNVYSCQRCSSIFNTQDMLVQHQQIYCLQPNKGVRYKPHIQRNLLENFGFECVMSYNETHVRRKKRKEGEGEEENGEKENRETEEKKMKKEEEEEKKKKDDLFPEVTKLPCSACKKEFSSIWVLKAHQEEVHRDIVPMEYLEKFSQEFKENYEKKQPPAPEPVVVVSTAEGQTVPAPKTPVSSEAPSGTPKIPGIDMDSLPPTPTTPADLAALQAAQMMQMPFLNAMMPMNMFGMPLAAMNMAPPLMPMMMPFGPEMGGMPMIPGMPMLDPLLMMQQQQQNPGTQPQPQSSGGSASTSSKQSVTPPSPAAVAAAQQAAQNNANKRARTRISDDQLKILRQYFDINNSPSEEQIIKMSEQSGLPQKVIKHWFRNTLFKERQRNKDSPYNFNNPPSTSINLEEYEKTGRIDVAVNNNNNNNVEKKDNNENNKGENPAVKKEPSSSPAENPGPSEATPKPQASSSSPSLTSMANSLPRTPSAPSFAASSVAASLIKGNPMMVNPFGHPLLGNPGNLHNNPHNTDSQDSQDRMDRPDSVSSMNSSVDMDSLPSMSTPSTSAPSTPAPPTNPSATHTEIVSALNNSLFTPPPHLTPAFDLSRHAVPHNSSPQTTSQMNPLRDSSASKRANRTRFTDYQIKVLQEFFERNAYPKDDDLDHLSKLLNLSPRVIVVWFQNARQKARKNYENQPPLDMSEDVTNGTRYQRTPGLNYQCKRCLTVFQRYYELIKHQKTHCYKEGKEGQAAADRDNSRYNESPGKSSHISPTGSTSSSSTASCTTPKSEKSSSLSTPTTPIAGHLFSGGSGSSVDKKPDVSQMSIPPAAALVAGPPVAPVVKKEKDELKFECDKCKLCFNRFDLWQEHQNVHLMNPNLFPAFPADSAFAMLQNVAQQQQQQAVAAAIHGDSPTKRKSEELDDESASEDGMSEQARDKRLRTTILPEQLDYLYQKYQVDCNPSRKQLETISAEVGLKKRVVQVWFQNTRARERKGQYRAHQQLIHKRCPFCRALFRARSALESHLATKHPEEMAKGEINVDNIPDAIENSPPSSNRESPATSIASGGTVPLDMNKLMSNPYNMPNPFMPGLIPPPSLGFPNSANDPMQLNMKRLYEDSLKKYIDELSGASHLPGGGPLTKEGVPTPQNKPPSGEKGPNGEEAPLDLSKPLGKPGEDSHGMLDDSLSENTDEMLDDTISNPGSPGSSTGTPGSTGSKPGTPSGANKRFRTQMSSTQIKIMKSLFGDYKTPTMAECEMLGKEIGLAKRVVQVWFQNARAKEKKSKLAYAKTFGTDVDFARPPEECKMCHFKYSHKYTVQDHIFTRKHIDAVRSFITSQGDSSSEYIDPTTMNQLMRQREIERAHKSLGTAAGGGAPPDMSALAGHPHLAQLQAMGLQAMSLPGPMAGQLLTVLTTVGTDALSRLKDEI